MSIKLQEELKTPEIQVSRVNQDLSTMLPTKNKITDACHDLYASESVTINPNFYIKVGTNTKIKLPVGWEALVATRSGHGSKGIQVHPGIIDYGYTNEIFVIVYNHTSVPYRVEAGDRIAQMKCRELDEYTLVEADFDSTDSRGGFGSSGK